MHATSTVEPLTATRPARRFKPSKNSQAEAQLAAVLFATALRDKLHASSADLRLKRDYQLALGNVVAAFSLATKRLARGFQGEDFLGQTVSREDLAQAVALGVAEAVLRYRPERANGGCVRFVLTRVRFALQQLTGSQRKKYDIVGLEDVGEGRIS